MRYARSVRMETREGVVKGRGGGGDIGGGFMYLVSFAQLN